MCLNVKGLMLVITLFWLCCCLSFSSFLCVCRCVGICVCMCVFIRYLVYESRQTQLKMGELMDVFGDHFIKPVDTTELKSVLSQMNLFLMETYNDCFSLRCSIPNDVSAISSYISDS